MFELVDEESPLNMGLEIKRYSNTCIMDKLSTITLRQTIDEGPTRFITYISNVEQKNARIRVEILPHQESTFESLLTSTIGRNDLSLAKKMHR